MVWFIEFRYHWVKKGKFIHSSLLPDFGDRGETYEYIGRCRSYHFDTSVVMFLDKMLALRFAICNRLSTLYTFDESSDDVFRSHISRATSYHGRDLRFIKKKTMQRTRRVRH